MSTPIPPYTTEGEALSVSGSSVLRLIRLSESDGRIHVLKTSEQPQELRIMQLIRNQVESQTYQRLFPVLYYYNEGRKSAMVMEHCEQGDLAGLVEVSRGISPSLEQGRRLILQLLEAVKMLHSLGIAHCDIKPHNVFITRNNFKLGDFGHAKVTTEQDRENEFKNDAFMLGSTLLEFFSGRLGMEANRFNPAKMQKTIRDAMLPYPDEFSAILSGLLILNAEARYSVGEVFRLLPSAQVSIAGNSEAGQQEEGPIETEPVDSYPPIRMDFSREGSVASLRADSPAANNQPLARLPRYVNPLTSKFETLVAELTVSVTVRAIESEIVSSKADELLRWLGSNGGKVTVSVTEVEMFQCPVLSHACFAINRVTLPCGCNTCRSCLNARVLNSAHSAGFTGTTQCLCGASFDPLQKSILEWLETAIINEVDSEILRQNVKCPKCTLLTDIKVRTLCQSMRCPCGYRFCTYCLKKPHKIFGCSAWKRDQVSR